MFKQSILAALLFTTSYAHDDPEAVEEDHDWTYETNGDDWSTWYPDCATDMQSPIDLIPFESDDFDYEILCPSKDDNLETNFNNQDMRFITWNGHSSKTELLDADADFDGTPSSISSNIPKDEFGENAPLFKDKSFHFHAPSEHTIAGELMDIEMHNVMYANEDEKFDGQFFNYAVLGIMFSVNNYNAELSWAQKRIIDNFFDSLQWDARLPDNEDGSLGALTDPTVDLISYGDMLNYVFDIENRWVYKGSFTTPPCTTGVYWNVLSTVYPISQKHLDLFLGQLGRNEDYDLVTFGNNRNIQEIDGHEVMYVQELAKDDSESTGGLIFGDIILTLLVAIFGIFTVYFFIKNTNSQKPNMQQFQEIRPAGINDSEHLAADGDKKDVLQAD